MTNRNFTLIKGGLSAPGRGDKKEFVSAYVTDTRLMGVVGLYIHWESQIDNINSGFHQFFHFDSEEYGFETYRSIPGNDISDIDYLEQALMGGLGGKKVKVTKKEAQSLLQSYANMNRKKSLPFPDGSKEYSFLLDNEVEMSEDEERVLFAKQCTPIISVYQAINYFLMRCFGKDFEAASFLTDVSFPIDIYSDIPVATLCKNTIDYVESEQGGSYLCESLIEHDAAYVLLVSEITVKENNLCSFEKCGGMPVTAVEAAMMLSRPEFVTVYEINCSPDEFDERIVEMTKSMLMTIHDTGRLFLSFKKNNDHVNNKVFRLNEDVSGIYYVTDYGQMIVAAYSSKTISAMEKTLRASSLSHVLEPVAKYEFKEPVLYEFIQSDFEDFEDFLDFIKE